METDKIIESIESQTDETLSSEVFDVEITEKGKTTFITGTISRTFIETFGGSYLQDKEWINTCTSREISIESMATYDDDGDEMPCTINKEEIENYYKSHD